MRSLLPLSVLATIQTALAKIEFRAAQDYSLDVESLFPRSKYPSVFENDRPDGCPACFNCNLDDFTCLQYGNCTKSSGKCSCPAGFGGDDCGQPLCGSLADGHDRLPRQGDKCECKEGWGGINCNVCETDKACSALIPGEEDGVCYKEGLLVKQNYQVCDVTNRKIVDMLDDRRAQVTFSCSAKDAECGFQFWVEEEESFYCHLDECDWDRTITDISNTTSYVCQTIKCSCIHDRFLCGKNGELDLGEFLETLTGPATFSTIQTEGGSNYDGSKFSEPVMNTLISSVFGDKFITLDCQAGECLYKTELPGYERPVKKINTPLIAGVIAGCALFIVAVVLLVFFLSRRSANKYDAISLGSEDEEDAAKLLGDHKPASLYFENVSYGLKNKQILTDITGSIHPGELLAIMGASGAGKTSFLDILARKNKLGSVKGNIWLNGEKVSDEEFRNVIGFVDQDDTMLATLTVHETIMDSALLRLPKEMTWASKAQRVEDVERQLGIYHIRNQIIGSEGVRGISGGEKRRVSIACELVTSPSVLFLDEPTSGLDAYNAFNVIECLVTLVKTYNRTVVFTIHQPRSNIVALFDRLLLLAQGRAVYSGPFDKCQEYFDSIGYTCPPGFNIADYLVDLTMHAGRPDNPIDDDFSGYEDDEDDGRATRTSSTMAIKSIPSVSNISGIHDASAESEGLLRPKTKRIASVRQQQERQLFSRKNTQDAGFAGGSLKSGHTSTTPQYRVEEVEGLSGTNLGELVMAFEASEVKSELSNNIHNAITTAGRSNGHANGALNGSAKGKIQGYNKPSIAVQFAIISRRTWRNLYRDPMLMLTHYAIAIVLAVFLGFLFYGLTDDLKGFQNRLGFFFFLLALFGFSTLTSLTTFSPERLLFVRERAKGYYKPLAYYMSKVVFDIVPLRLIPPIIMGCIVYPMTGLVPSFAEFGKFMLFLVLFNLAAATMCLFIGICVKNAGVANLLGVLVMLFSLLFGGFLLNHETIPTGLTWLQSVSTLDLGMTISSNKKIVVHIPLRIRGSHCQ